MQKQTKKSCENCKWLSKGTSVEFTGSIFEERVICTKGQWHNGSVISFSLKKHSYRYKQKAKTCHTFQTLVILK